jgi:hypothetical protein
MTRRLSVGLAGLGRMGRIHAANLSARCPSARLAFDLAQAADLSWRRGRPVTVEPLRTAAGVLYKVEGPP